MKRFNYKARKGPGKLEEGIVEAGTEAGAIKRLTQMGYFPISVSLEAEGPKEKTRGMNPFKNIRHRQLTTFTRQLSDLLDSGLTLYKALTVLERQTENRQLQNVIQGVAEKVKEGRSLSDSLRDYPRTFNNMYISMVRAGEASGTLEKVLKRLADFGEKQEDILAKVQAAMAYPVLMAAVGVISLIVLFSFVIPQLVGLFEDMGQILPLPTRILIALSDFFLKYWWIILAVAAFVFFALRRNLFSAKGKLAFSRFKLRLPVLGKFLTRIEIANFSRTLGALLANAVPILQALDSVYQTLESEVFKEEIKRIVKEIKEGSTLAKSIAKSSCFPPLVGNMISVGEEGGALEAALFKVSSAYEKETDQSIRLFTSLIEPVLILTMSFIIAFVVLAMLLPIFQISLVSG
ncbi:MAG: type II secretion system F family protein [Candidatus Omnitrophota bacterium]|nr:MAG: type II secretion system F family protein [Candidatus Omnitrophota bacterium]